VEGEGNMTDEELKQEMQIVGEDLEKLPADDKSLTKEQKKDKNLLLMKKDVLLRIKDAREKSHKQVEFDNTVYYGVLNSWFSKHPFLMRFVINAKCRWNVW